jgi:hypothetical protein
MAGRLSSRETNETGYAVCSEVKIGPGPTAFTRMPSGEWSAASARVKPATAALLAVLGEIRAIEPEGRRLWRVTVFGLQCIDNRGLGFGGR